MNFSVIICTCNRHEKVMELVNELVGLNCENIEIILIDSSDEEKPILSSLKTIKYHHTKHKNQPYQRFLGHALSTSDYLLYLDDDMEIIHDNLFEKLEGHLSNPKIAGLALKFIEAHSTTSLSEVPISQLFGKSQWLKRFKNIFSGIPDLPPGKLGMNGNKGKQPEHIGPTEFVSGGAFLVKKSILYRNFNFQMFDLYDEKSGKGEDAITGYGIYKQGLLLHIPEVLFRHNDQQNSSYSSNLENFGFRVMYSRLYLSLEKSRLDKSSLFKAKIAFHWFAIWRILGLSLNTMIRKNDKRKKLLRGTVKGWKKSFRFHFDSNLNRNDFWTNKMLAETTVKK